MFKEIKKIKFDKNREILDITFSNIHKNIIYIITKKSTILVFDIDKNNYIKSIKIEAIDIDFDKKVEIKISPNDKYIALFNKYGSLGYLYNLKNFEIIYKLDRKNYHTEQSIFPINFISIKGKIYLVCGTDWNHIDIFDIENRTIITKRENRYKGNFYLDYFYGELHFSEDKKRVLSSGWVWGPASIIKFISFEDWFNKNIHQPEIKNDPYIGINSYYWDRALCWINNDIVAYLYDPKEEWDITEKEEYLKMGIEFEKSYILFYQINDLKIIKRVEFSNFLTNEYFEADKSCKMFFQKYLYISSEKFGVSIVDINSEKTIYQNSKIEFEKFQKNFGIFYKFDKNCVLNLLIQ